MTEVESKNQWFYQQKANAWAQSARRLEAKAQKARRFNVDVARHLEEIAHSHSANANRMRRAAGTEPVVVLE